MVVSLAVLFLLAGCAETSTAPSETANLADPQAGTTVEDGGGASNNDSVPGDETGSTDAGTDLPSDTVPEESATEVPSAEDSAANATAVPGPGVFRVHYVDVGQGDGTVWVLPGGGVVVYDCGDTASSASTNPVVKVLKERVGLKTGDTIHALVSSHGHLDHIGGCEEVLSEFQVLHVYEAWYDGASPPASYKAFQDQVKAEGALVHVLKESSTIDGEVVFHQLDYLDVPEAANASGFRAQIIWPPAFQSSVWSGIARSSLAVRVTHGTTSFCFQGDIESGQEKFLAQSSLDFSCDVYLMGHHGSKEASSAAWLAKMNPSIAIVSFGQNGYGHPTPEALCRVQTEGASVYATHHLGTITVESDGANLTISPNQSEAKDYCQAGVAYWT